MPVYTVPQDAGPFVVARSRDGEFTVVEEAALSPLPAAALRVPLVIPCRDEPQARGLCEQLNRREHDGTVQVDLLWPAPGGELQ